ncbi:MAG: DUF2865 domain-containing protein [Bosea sp. (in: a-proteobacteria)]
MTPFFARLLALCAILIAAPAVAQSPQCDGWRAEVARIDRSGGGNAGAGRQAGRISADLNRTIAQYRGLGCEQAGGFFGPAPHPQCGAVRQRIGELQGALGSVQRQAQGGGNSARRGELVAAINAYCRQGVYQAPQPAAVQEAPRPRGFFEALFGLPEQQRAPIEAPAQEQTDPLFDKRPEKPKTATWGAGRPVCVRACDGFFFPLHTNAGGRDDAQELCQALCPASETSVFYMGGNGEIENAAGRTGPYTALANANRYTRSFDSACSCRKPGQSWSSALAEAEELLDRRRGDVIVTAAKAEELSKPRETRETRRAAEQRKRQETAAAEARSPEARVNEAIAAASPEAAAMVAATEGQASAGIGPQAIVTQSTVSVTQGQTRTMTSEDGEQRKVRMVAPALSPQATPDITVRR